MKNKSETAPLFLTITQNLDQAPKVDTNVRSVKALLTLLDGLREYIAKEGAVLASANDEEADVLSALDVALKGTAPKQEQQPGQDPGNAILVIAPYWDEDVKTWIFDDETKGVWREPFVEGIPEMIDRLVDDIPNAREGFRLLFSKQAFPGARMHLIKDETDAAGVWYRDAETGARGWLCPCLFHYFPTAPEHLYAKAEALGTKT